MSECTECARLRAELDALRAKYEPVTEMEPVPPIYVWRAMDEDGEWRDFTDKPECWEDMWEEYHYTKTRRADPQPPRYKGRWEDSLTRIE